MSTETSKLPESKPSKSVKVYMNGTGTPYTIEDVPVNLVTVSAENNFGRSDPKGWSTGNPYNFMELVPFLRESNGVPSDLPAIHLVDGQATLSVLRGNRRILALQFLSKHEPNVKYEKVTCKVYRNLDKTTAKGIALDHHEVQRSINRYEFALTVVQYRFELGMKENAIVAKMRQVILLLNGGKDNNPDVPSDTNHPQFATTVFTQFKGWVQVPAHAYITSLSWDLYCRTLPGSPTHDPKLRCPTSVFEKLHQSFLIDRDGKGKPGDANYVQGDALIGRDTPEKEPHRCPKFMELWKALTSKIDLARETGAKAKDMSGGASRKVLSEASFKSLPMRAIQCAVKGTASDPTTITIVDEILASLVLSQAQIDRITKAVFGPEKFAEMQAKTKAPVAVPVASKK